MLKYKYSKPFNSKNMYYDNHKKNSICVFEFNRKFVFDIFEIQKIINNGVGILSDDVLIHSTIKKSVYEYFFFIHRSCKYLSSF